MKDSVKSSSPSLVCTQKRRPPKDENPELKFFIGGCGSGYFCKLLEDSPKKCPGCGRPTVIERKDPAKKIKVTD